MPCYRHLVNLNNIINHTWVIGIDKKTVDIDVFPQFLVENQCTLKQSVQGLVHLHIQYEITHSCHNVHNSVTD